MSQTPAVRSPFEEWLRIAATFPHDHFCSVDGQRQAAASSDWPSQRPASWSLPAILGPWPCNEEGTVIRILSLLPSIPAGAIGAYLAGTWRLRDMTQQSRVVSVLYALRDAGQATVAPSTHGAVWQATKPVAPRLIPTEPQIPMVRAFIDSARLFVLDTKGLDRVAAKRLRVAARLRELLQAPESDRTSSWHAEVREIEYLQRALG